MFSKKGDFEFFAKLAEKHLFPSPTQVCYCQLYEIFENTFLQNIFYKNWKKQAPEVFSKKGDFEFFAKLAEKHLFPSPTQVCYCQLYEIFENTFLQNTSGRLLLMKRLDSQKF